MGDGKLQAPFAPGGVTEIDAALARRLLELALSAAATTPISSSSTASGADYVLEDERVARSGAASRSASACASPRATPPATPTPRS